MKLRYVVSWLRNTVVLDFLHITMKESYSITNESYVII